MSGNSRLPTSPDLPCILRNHRLESDKTSGWMSLEQYLCPSDPYRFITVLDPLPYPLSTKRVPGKTAEISWFYKSIAAILDSHGFDGQYDIGVVTLSKPGYPDGERPVDILQIEYWLDATIPRAPEDALDRIQGLLAENDINIDVEIVDCWYCFNPRLFAIMPDDPTVAAFEQARERFIHVLNCKLPERWRSLCLFYVRPSRWETMASIASIVVMVDAHIYCDWSELRFSMLREVRQDLDPGVPLQVEFLPGEACPDLTGAPGSLQPEKDTDIEPLPASQLSKMDGIGRLKMGMSISPKGQDSIAGTMGGFVTITRDGVTHQGLLTTYDVVRPFISTATEADRNGISIDRPSCPNIEIIYPAIKDARQTMIHAEAEVKELKEQLDKLTERKNNYELVGKELGLTELERLDIVQKQLEDCGKALQAVQGIPFRIGKVIFASGVGFSGTTLLNWAFVEITEPGVLKFFRRDQMPDVPECQRPYRQLPNTNSHDKIVFYFQGQSLTRIGVLEKGECYVMVGRSSGTQVGFCNGTKASCLWRKNKIRYDGNGNAPDAAKITHEYVVVSEYGIAGRIRDQPFCEPGDSGAFLINPKAEVCGLLYGYMSGTWAEPEWYVNVGLVTCMKDVSMSIQALATPRDAQGNPTGTVELDLP